MYTSQMAGFAALATWGMTVIERFIVLCEHIISVNMVLFSIE